MNDYISLYEVTPETGGIFSALDSYAVPWKEDIDSDLLDLQYYGNVSGEKIISPLVYKNLDENGKLTVSKQSLIASMTFKIYGGNWIKEWATLSKQYDPIANYDMTEIMDDDETVIEYGKTEDTTTGNTHTKTGTETDTPDVTITTDDSIYGFNSSSASDSNKRVESPSGTNETEYDLSETDSGSVGLEQGGSDTHTRNYTLTRKGNIGVTTSQQLLQAERDLWMWNFFEDVVFPDIDKILTIPIYAETTGYSGSSGGVTPTGTIYITENGNRIDVASFAYANVNVPNTYSAADEGKVVSDGTLVAQTSRNITENGTYDTTENNQAIVNVPNTYSAADEGKVVSNGALVAQTSREITENGTYDTTENNSVEVAVPGTVIGGTTDPTTLQGSNGDIYIKYVDATILPAGYTLLEYIKADGTQYIDTGVPARQQLKTVLDHMFEGNSDQTMLGGNGGSTSVIYLGFNPSMSGYYANWSGSWIDMRDYLDNNRNTIITSLESGNIVITKNGDEIYSSTSTLSGTTSSDNLNVFTRSNGEHKATARLYNLKIYDLLNNGELIRNFYPARRNADNEMGLYDVINNEFYTNDGTGSFISGGILTGTPIDSAYLKVNGSWIILENGNWNDVNH